MLETGMFGFSESELDVFRLKTIDMVIRNTKEAEDRLRSYESRLRDVSTVPAEEDQVEAQRSQLQVGTDT